MQEDLSLGSLHYHGLCSAIERGGVICFSPIQVKGYCWKHYCRLRKHGTISLPIKLIKKCKFIDCNKAYHSSGYCKNHYQQHLKRTISKKCSALECQTNTVGKYCSKHRTRLYRYGTLEGSGKKKGRHFKPGETYTIKEYKICLAKCCGRDSNKFKITKGLCPKHYQRWRLTKVYDDLD